MRASRWLVGSLGALLALPPLAGCSSSDDARPGAPVQGSGGGAATTGSGGGGSGAGEDLTTYEADVPAITAMPGEEATRCITVSLGNEEGAFVRRFRADLDAGSHHMIVYRSDDAAPDPTFVDCNGFSGVFAGDYPFFIAQQATATLELPKDGGKPVGFEIRPQQVVRIELHYINTTGAPIQVAAHLYTDTLPLGADVVKSDMFFAGTTQFQLPPNTKTTTPVRFQKAPSGTETFAITTHQHSLGTRMRVWRASSADDIDHDPVADGTDWADPKLVQIDPPLPFPTEAGAYSSMGFAYQCEWNNTTDAEVHFGEGFHDEMCFFWQYYYPSKGFFYCVDGICATKD